MIVAACATEAGQPTPTLASIGSTATTTEASVAETPIGVGTATAGVPVTGSATVNIHETADYGPILVNEDGFALYMFMNDTQNSAASTCVNDCALIWPPLITDGPPVAGEGVDDFLLSTLPREDGSTQVMYEGWPLYLYHADAAPGETLGQGVSDSGGTWFLVSPAGEAIQQ